MKLYKPKPIKWVHKLKAESVTHVYNIVKDLDRENYLIYYHELHTGETNTEPKTSYEDVVNWIENIHAPAKLLGWFDIEEVNETTNRNSK